MQIDATDPQKNYINYWKIQKKKEQNKENNGNK